MEPLCYRCAACGAINRVPAARLAEGPSCGRCKQALDVDGAPQAVDDDGLARAIAASPVPVLVDFWAPWCGPCRMAAPMVEKVARTHAGRALVLKLDTEEHPRGGSRHGVRGIPTFVAFAGGREVAREVGLVPEARLAALLS